MQTLRKAKKRLIQVTGNPAYAHDTKREATTPGMNLDDLSFPPNHFLISPKTNTLDWGQFPEVNVKSRIFPAGPIRLRYGIHRGPNNGFGLAHIWEAHFSGKKHATPMLALAEIADFLTEILSAGAQIYYEYGVGKAGDKTTVFKHKKGIVVVEEREDEVGNTIYSIVTAFPGRSAHGVLVGRLI